MHHARSRSGEPQKFGEHRIGRPEHRCAGRPEALRGGWLQASPR